MGINYCEAEALLALKRQGEAKQEILCLGRPELFLARGQAVKLVRRFGLNGSGAAVNASTGSVYADDFLKAIGFERVRSLDASAYEGADLIHDLNAPLPPELMGATDFLYDGGTIEHIFDVAAAFRNIAGLTRPGGTALISTAANGQCGHGFYQYAPELFYRAFEAYGFENVRVYLVGLQGSGRWVLAKDPKLARRRVQFYTSEPTQLFAIARRSGAQPAFSVPQQSDYQEGVWTMEQKAVQSAHAQWRSPKARLKAALRDRVLYPAAVLARSLGAPVIPGLWRRDLFAPIDPARNDL